MSEKRTQQAQLRYLQDTLTIIGSGVIAFGVWTMAKTALLFVFYNEQGMRQLLQIGNDIPMLVAVIIAIFAGSFDLIIRLFVGFSARAEGHGEKKGSFYLVVAGLIAVGNILSIVGIIFGSTVGLSRFDAVISLIVDATSLATLLLMVRCAVRLRQLSLRAE